MDYDDFFSLPVDFPPQNNYHIEYDDLITDEFLSSPETDQERSHPSSASHSSQESHVPGLICGVCGAPAHGYNFDQITCESCKAFFRRNALRHTPNLRCRYSGSCVINVQTRRQCTYCRLKKCFDIKMRKDWIRTEEEIELRQLQKLAKEEKKRNKTTNDQQTLDQLPIVVRKKKRLMLKSITQELLDDSVNITD